MDEESDYHEQHLDDGDGDVLVGVDQRARSLMQRPLRRKIALILSEISVEPSLWLIMFAYGISGVISQVKAQSSK